MLMSSGHKFTSQLPERLLCSQLLNKYIANCSKAERTKEK
ncbi:hypothetical protein AALB_3139 [Agarivorans albus MKT 106]|uniref:Uncharacterized protein n=1 Tax=Agarivorans albus MKT 106 TaxID=1331007 RepID=R9PNX8_AGAAL|nr:hypothetical protein AALB_3139 [Agarivorans albus MKT 106]